MGVCLPVPIPTLTGWANVLRAYGAENERQPESGLSAVGAVEVSPVRERWE